MNRTSYDDSKVILGSSKFKINYFIKIIFSNLNSNFDQATQKKFKKLSYIDGSHAVVV